MIDKQLKCIFVHCQKCAGESIEEAVFGRADNNYRGCIFAGSPEKHFSASQYIVTYGQQIWTDFFTFSFVRNPWDRVISWIKYRDKRFGRLDPLSPEKIKQEVTSPLFSNNSYRNLLFNKKGDLLVKYVGRFENIENDFQFLSKKINIKYKNLPHLNKTSHEDYRRYFDEETVNLVHTIYRHDIEYFGYSFDKK